MDEITKLISRFGHEIKGIVRNCLELSWYSRGAWTYEAVMRMNAGERDIASTFINKRLEAQSKLPSTQVY